MVRYFVAPSIWLAMGLLGVFMPAHLSTEKYLRNKSQEQRKQLRATVSHGLQYVFGGAIGLFCLVNTVVAAWTGRGYWWMWMLATMAHIAGLVSRERAVNRLMVYAGEKPKVLTQHERTRQRYVAAFVTVSALTFAIGSAVLPPGNRADAEPVQVIVGGVLLTIAIVTAVAAGWAAVWAFKSRGERP